MEGRTATCPICSAEAHRAGRPARFTIFRCPACTHRFAKIPEGYDIAKAYSGEYTGFRPDERFLENLRRSAALRQKLDLFRIALAARF